MPKAVMLGLTLLAFALRVYHLGGHSLWYDELLQLDIVQGHLGHIWPQLERHSAMPLDYYLLHAWVQGGRQEFWVRFPAVVWGTLAVPILYALGRRVLGERAGVVAAALLAVSSFAVEYSQEARPYALLLLWSLVAILGAWQVYQTGRGRFWLLAAAGLLGAIFSHYFALFLLVPLGLWVLMQPQGRCWRQTLSFGLVALLVVIALAGAGQFWRLYSVGIGFSRVAHTPHLLTAPAEEKPNGGSGPPVTLDLFRWGIVKPLTGDAPLYWGVGAGLLAAALLPGRTRGRRAKFLLLGWLILPVGLIYTFLLYRGTFYAPRYILYTLPAFLLLLACGIEAIASRVPRRATVPVLVLLVLPLLLVEGRANVAHFQAASSEDWRAVAHLLRANAAPTDPIVAVRAVPAVNWYYPQGTRVYNGFDGLNPAAVDYERGWFVLSSYSQRQDADLRAWLDSQQAVHIALDRRVEVYFYQPGATARQQLDAVRGFALPQKARTYLILGDQWLRLGASEVSRTFYQQALSLARTPADVEAVQRRLDRLAAR